jgi:hypothetical protein
MNEREERAIRETYRTMTPRGLRLEARAIRGAAERMMNRARELDTLADEREQWALPSSWERDA